MSVRGAHASQGTRRTSDVAAQARRGRHVAHAQQGEKYEDACVDEVVVRERVAGTRQHGGPYQDGDQRADYGTRRIPTPRISRRGGRARPGSGRSCRPPPAATPPTAGTQRADPAGHGRHQGRIHEKGDRPIGSCSELPTGPGGRDQRPASARAPRGVPPPARAGRAPVRVRDDGQCARIDGVGESDVDVAARRGQRDPLADRRACEQQLLSQDDGERHPPPPTHTAPTTRAHRELLRTQRGSSSPSPVAVREINPGCTRSCPADPSHSTADAPDG